MNELIVTRAELTWLGDSFADMWVEWSRNVIRRAVMAGEEEVKRNMSLPGTGRWYISRGAAVTFRRKAKNVGRAKWRGRKGFVDVEIGGENGVIMRGVGHQASSAGSAPSADIGEEKNAVAWSIEAGPDRQIGRVGVLASATPDRPARKASSTPLSIRAAALEFGTRDGKITARPAFEPALQGAIRFIREAIDKKDLSIGPETKARDAQRALVAAKASAARARLFGGGA